MAARASWKGTIALGLVQVKIEAFTATQKYAGDEPIKELCACHNQPLDRSHKCAVTHEAPQGKVKAAQKADGSYVVLSDAQVESIKAGLTKELIEPLGYEPREDVDISALAGDLWELAPNHKESGAGEAVRALYDTLESRERVLRARVVTGKQTIVLIYPDDGKLKARRALYPQEQKLSEAGVLALAQLAPTPNAATGMLDALLSELPEAFDMSTVGDVTKERKAQVIAQAVAGEAVEPMEATTEVEPSSPVPDLMAKLSASVAAAEAKTGKKPARKRTTTKEGVKT